MKKVVINSSDLKNNIEILKKLLEEKSMKNDIHNSKIIDVVKANGMGLDLVQFSHFLIENGINDLAVATFEEAKELIQNDVSCNLLMLSPINDENELKYLIENNVILTIGSKENLKRAENICDKLDKDISAHIKIDVGLGRYGFIYNDFEKIKYVYDNSKRVKLSGIYSHMVNSIVKEEAIKQFERFNNVLSFLKDNNYDVGVRHIAASRPFILYDDMVLDAVRLGTILTGRSPFKVEGLKKIGKYETIISEIRNIPKGHTISYGGEFIAPKDMKVAVISTGYMDGFSIEKDRSVYDMRNNILCVLKSIKNVFKKNKYKAIINDKEYNVIGRIGMFHSIIDIENDNVNIDDKVVLNNIEIVHVNANIRREYI